MLKPHIIVIGIAVLAAGVAPAYAQACLYSEAPRDHCSTARVISGNVGQHVVLMDATNATSSSEVFCGVSVGHTVWFDVTPVVSGPMTISTCHPATTYDTVLSVWSGGESECEFMTFEGCIDDTDAAECDNGCSSYGSRLTLNAISGRRYRFAVGSYNNNAAGCILCLGVIVTIGTPCGDAPTNLFCQLARELPGTPGTHEATIDATDALPNPSTWTCGYNPGHAVWFSTTPTISGSLTFSTCHPNTTYDTVVRALTGDCSGPMYEITCQDDTFDPACSNSCGGYHGSTVTIDVDAGSTYYFQVGAYNDNGAGCTLCLGVRMTLSDPCEDEASAPLANISWPGDFQWGCDYVDLGGEAWDPDGTFDNYSLDYRPVGSSTWTTFWFSNSPVPPTGWLGQWDASALPQGYYMLRLTVQNACGMSNTQMRLVWRDTTFDTVEIRGPAEGSIVGGTACIDGSVWDNFCFQQYTVDYHPVTGGLYQPVNPATPVYYTPVINDPLASWSTTPGIPDGDYELRIIGTTTCGDTATVFHDLTVDNTTPIGVISSPAACENVAGTVQIRGTAADAHLASWALYYTGGDAHGWVPISGGLAPVINGVLGNWNTSGLRPCAYTLRLLVSDQSIVNCNGAITNWTEYTTSVTIGGAPCPGDINGDRRVDNIDLQVILDNWARICP
jgi:hypothetical protein